MESREEGSLLAKRCRAALATAVHIETFLDGKRSILDHPIPYPVFIGKHSRFTPLR